MERPEVAIKTRPPAGCLELVADLFARLHSEGVVYCHWKSNEHLGASMAGSSDLDLLVHRSWALPLARILGEHDFKRFVPRPGRGYPGIEDFVGLDRVSGKLIHLHVHYQLTVGEVLLKGYRLPWEDPVLSTRIFDNQHCVYVADPNLEVLLLVARASLKVRTRDRILERMGRPYVRGSTWRELHWLSTRIERESSLGLAHRLVGARAARQLLEMVAGVPPSIGHLLAWRTSCVPALKEYRMYSGVDALRRRWSRELRLLVRRVGRRFFGATASSSRTPLSGGLIVAIIGADGAGKSTVTREIVRWLSKQTAVSSEYGGSGSGPVSLPRRSLQVVGALVRGATKGLPKKPRTVSRRDATGDSAHDTNALGLKSLWRLLSALALARERRIRALRARRARSLGYVVVFDRLPQTQFPGLNDGPQLSAWLDSSVRALREAAKIERAAYRSAELCAPDLVVKLQVSPEVALARKPTTPAEKLRRKVEIVRTLRYPQSTRVLDVDANRPADEVLMQVKCAIWDCL